MCVEHSKKEWGVLPPMATFVVLFLVLSRCVLMRDAVCERHHTTWITCLNYYSGTDIRMSCSQTEPDHTSARLGLKHCRKEKWPWERWREISIDRPFSLVPRLYIVISHSPTCVYAKFISLFSDVLQKHPRNWVDGWHAVSEAWEPEAWRWNTPPYLIVAKKQWNAAGIWLQWRSAALATGRGFRWCFMRSWWQKAAGVCAERWGAVLWPGSHGPGGWLNSVGTSVAL